MDQNYDVAIVGGGAAGLSAALTLSRARRKVVVIDAGSPRNAPSAHVHNYLGREGASPLDLLADGRAEVMGYGGEIVEGTVLSTMPLGESQELGFSLLLCDGRALVARRILAATGLVDELPDVPGVAERWGRDVLHCPYCHGWEVRDQAIGILATGPNAIHLALLFRQWSADVTLFQHTCAPPSPDQVEQLTARGIKLVAGEVAALEVAADRITGVRLKSGETVPAQAMVVMPRFTARAGLLSALGLEPVVRESGGHIFGSYIPAGDNGATTIPGVWVAGNVSDMVAGVINSAAAGMKTATHINADLVDEDTRQAVAAVSTGTM